MKGLKKVALVSAIAAVSAGAQAELKALDDAAMGELTGQAGLTIDIESQLSIGEFAYVDGGAVVFRDIYRGGQDDANGNRTLLDNIRLTLDVADGTESFNYGMSEVRGLAGVHVVGFGNQDGGMQAAAGGTDTLAGGNQGTALIDDKRVAGDGDLVLHFGFTDAWEKGGGFAAYTANLGSDGNGGQTDMTNLTYAAARQIAADAVDFQFEIGQIALADSGFGAGMYDRANDAWLANDNGRIGQEVISKTDHVTGLDTDTETNTTLISDLKISGYLGPMDIIIENKGNGFGADGSGLGGAPGTGNADSKILWDSFVKVTDLDVYIDIAGVALKNIRIHNVRGDITSLNEITYTDANGVQQTENTSAFGFAHSKREIYAVKDTVLQLETLSPAWGPNVPATAPFVDGIAINTRFKGDIDIGHLSFGNTDRSIGELYFTDIESTTNYTISAH